MRSNVRVGLLFAAVAALSTQARAIAVAPPPPSGDATAYSEILLGFDAGVFYDDYSSDANANLSHTTSGTATLSASTLMTAGEAPAVTATTSRTGGIASGTVALSHLIYYVQVSGPASEVTIDMTSAGMASASGMGAYAEADVGFLGVAAGSACASSDGTCGVAGSFSVARSYTVQTGTWLQVSIYAEAQTGGYGTESSGNDASDQAASAWVDPTFSIDSSQADGGAYTFSYSPQLAAVPEPASVALLLAGLGVMSVSSRRRPTDR